MKTRSLKFTATLSATLFSMAALVWLAPVVASAQGTGFNFQGRLNDGTTAANGSYDLQFRLYTAITGGAQIGELSARPNTTLINGVFSITLDFGATAFNSPNSIFIEIAVKPNGSPNAFTILGPRQQLTVVPFAVRSATTALADNATNAVNAANAQNSVNATNATNATNAINATNATNATTATNATNATIATNATNATTALTANNALNLGGVTPASYARLDFANPGNLLATGLLLTNDARQPASAYGLVKAMLSVDANNATILFCHNSITNSSTGTCGFIVTRPLTGVTRINFGFPVAGRFASVTPIYLTSADNYGANYRGFDATSLEVFTFFTDNRNDTANTSFTIILY